MAPLLVPQHLPAAALRTPVEDVSQLTHLTRRPVLPLRVLQVSEIVMSRTRSMRVNNLMVLLQMIKCRLCVR